MSGHSVEEDAGWDDCGHHPEWSSRNGCRHPDCLPSAEKDALAHELRLRLRSAEDMLEEARRRVSDAEDALDAHIESRVLPPEVTQP